MVRLGYVTLAVPRQPDRGTPSSIAMLRTGRLLDSINGTLGEGQDPDVQ